MSKSATGDSGALRLLDEPDVVRRKVMRAVTDAGSTVGYDPQRQPGVSNLLTILAACTGGDLKQLAHEFDQYGKLKYAVADAVTATIAPIRERYREIEADLVTYVRTCT